jgi:hypothetical protein
MMIGFGVGVSRIGNGPQFFMAKGYYYESSIMINELWRSVFERVLRSNTMQIWDRVAEC